MKTIVVCSGGLDSVTLAHKIAPERTLTRLVSFDYGQRHKKELEYASRCATHLMVPHDVVDIAAVGRLLTGSALTSGGTVPDGHYAEETMRTTVVPNRNAVMLAVAFGVAAAERGDAVIAAVHGGDHFIYPDCRLPLGFRRSLRSNAATRAGWTGKDLPLHAVPADEQSRYCARGREAWRPPY